MTPPKEFIALFPSEKDAKWAWDAWSGKSWRAAIDAAVAVARSSEIPADVYNWPNVIAAALEALKGEKE